jgi:hypothetical protein
MLRSPRAPDRHIAALVQTETRASLLLADVPSSKSKAPPRLVLAEELAPEDALARVRQLADDAAGSRLSFTVWQPLEGSDAAALTIAVDRDLLGADEAEKAEGCLARTPWTDDVIADEDLYIEYLARSNRIHFAAVRGDVIDARERHLEGVPVLLTPLSHALVSLVERCHPETFLPKGPMSLAILCLPRSLAALVAARGELLLVTQFDLTQLIRSEATALREGQVPPYGYRGQVPQTAAELETLVYHRVLESALEHVRRMLVEKGENPEAIRRISYAGEAVAGFDLADYLATEYGSALEVQPILATKTCHTRFG